MDTHRGDRGSIVIGWLTKLAVILAMVGVVLFDAIAVGVNHVTAADDASTAASAAAADWAAHHDVQSAYAAAVNAVQDADNQVLTKGFAVAADGSVQLRVRRETRTLLLHHIGPLKKYEIATATGEAAPATG